MEEDYASTQDAEAPHWDRTAHFKTQEELRQRAEARRRERAQEEGWVDEGIVLRFVVVAGIVVVCMTIVPTLAENGKARTKRKGDG
jgi:hypothetical protein